MRKPPSLQPPQEIKKRADVNIIHQTREYELITPLFGGGVEPGFSDPVTIIRGAGIRGQLRFWWRACRGSQFNGDLEAMKDGEGAIWGEASSANDTRPSSVQVATVIDENHRGVQFIVRNHRGEEIPVEHLSSPYGYVAFPLRDKQVSYILSGVKFTLNISFPKAVQPDVEAALWAWETFGGIGARTRRGFGALHLISINGTAAIVLPADAQSVERNVRQQLAAHVSKGVWPDGVPHLSHNLVFKATNKFADPLTAWQHLIYALKKFRQPRHPGTQPNRPGRSKWPEPDAIRRLTRAASNRHRIPLSTVNKFPRAAFGLPVIFKFKDDQKGDPPKTTLKGSNSERLGSPLILRPISVGRAEAVGLAVILDTPSVPPGGLILEGAPENLPVQSTLTVAEAATIAPLANLSPIETDVLKAFLRTL